MEQYEAEVCDCYNKCEAYLRPSYDKEEWVYFDPLSNEDQADLHYLDRGQKSLNAKQGKAVSDKNKAHRLRRTIRDSRYAVI